MDRYICIHGHFYQPPRENAWLEYVEMQDSAYPYHDWNERVTAECYAPNAASRILDRDKYITQIVNNYTKISFNFGPTLLIWMQENAPDTYQAILDADRESQHVFSGHGAAIAQAYNHMIMPLANRRDKLTQVIWGIGDFEHRFGRRPEGMWLPETAVDLETLDILAEQGVIFTILAPHQASRVRQVGTETWNQINDASIDPTMSYQLNLPSGRKLNLFFYDGPIARDVAFGDLLKSGDGFASRLAGSFCEERTWPQLVHIATDGETYGHHHRFGDMALAYALHHIEANGLARITNYGEYLEKHPPTHEVEINENTSWSCLHGIERWRSDCGCNAGRNPRWNQAWRAPLREALDWLRDTLAPKYEERAREFLKDPWAARDAYIEVVLNRSPDNIHSFLERHGTRELDETELVTVLKMLELQRHTMLMYTSCGWFFDELSGIETIQVIQYAGRAVQLAEELFGDHTEQEFLAHLELARSNLPKHGDGHLIYDKFVKPAMVDLAKVGAHYAISSLFEEYEKHPGIYCYNVKVEDYQSTECGKTRLVAGRAWISSVISQETKLLTFGVLHLGDHNMNAGIRDYQGEEAYQAMIQETTQTCVAADFPEVVRLLDKHFGVSNYSLKSLFRDEQRYVLDRILENMLADVETSYRQLHENYYPLMRFLADLGNPLPKALHATSEFILNTDLHKALANDTLDVERVRSLLDDSQLWSIDLDTEGLARLFEQSLVKTMAHFASHPNDTDSLESLKEALTLSQSLPFDIDLWRVQNLYHKMLKDTYPEFQKRVSQGDEKAREWSDLFVSIGQQLSIRVS